MARPRRAHAARGAAGADAVAAVAGAVAPAGSARPLPAGPRGVVHAVPHRSAPGAQRASLRARVEPPRHRVVPLRDERRHARRHARGAVQPSAPPQALHGRGRRRGGECAPARLAGHRDRALFSAAAALDRVAPRQAPHAPVDRGRARRQRALDHGRLRLAREPDAALPRPRHGRGAMPHRLLRRLDRAPRHRDTRLSCPHPARPAQEPRLLPHVPARGASPLPAGADLPPAGAGAPARRGHPGAGAGDGDLGRCEIGSKWDRQRKETVMIMEITYPLYLAISIAVTVWVARSLSRNGRVFLVDSFGGHEQLADSINHLLVVGFYLINIGYVTLALRYGEKPTDVTGAMEYLSSKVGLVLVVLGAMHFFNMYAILKLRRKTTQFYEERIASDAPAASPIPAPAKVY